MSLTENIGGFFVSLGLVTDRKSFNDGINGIKGLETSVKKIIGTAGAAATALTGLGAAASHLETDAMKTAHAIGISYQNIDKWRTAVSLAGVSAKGLTSEMLQLENKMQRLKLGDVDSGLARTLGMLRISYGQFADMTAEQRMTAVFGSASRMQDQRKAALLVGDALGSAAQEYYRYLQMTDRTLEDELAASQRLVFTDDRTKRDAVEFMYELKGLTSAVKSIGSLLGAEVGRQLTPVIRNIKEIIARNKELIKTGIIGFVDAAGKAFSAAVGVMERVGPVVGSLIDKLGGLDRVIEGIGLGILTIKAAGVVGGIAKIISSMGLLKTAIAGLGLGALYLLVDDIMHYFTGQGRSVTGLVVEAIKGLREELSINPDMEFWEKFTGVMETILKAVGIDYDSSELRKLIDAHPEWSAWEKFSHAFTSIAEALGLKIDTDNLVKIGEALGSIKQSIMGDRTLGEFVRDMASGGINIALGVISAVTGGVATLIPHIKDFIDAVKGDQSLSQWITGIAEGLSGFVFGTAGQLIDTLGGIVRYGKKAIDAVSGGEDLWKWLGGLAGEVLKFGEGAAKNVIDVITGLIGSDIPKLINSVTGGESLFTWLGGLVDSLAKFAGTELSAGIGIIGDLLDLLRALWDGDWDEAGAAIDRFFGHLKDGFKGVRDLIMGGEASPEAILSQGGVKGMAAQTAYELSDWQGYHINKRRQAEIADILRGAKSSWNPFTGMTKEDIANLTDYELQGVYNWLANGGTLEPFKGFMGAVEDTVTEQDILDAYTQRGIAKKNIVYTPKIDQTLGIQDGIISPGGGITRVAPDDWVFAVRNVADLAAAFMPSAGYSVGDQTITVNQTVNIQGGTNLAPATITQAAKQGVHGALQEMMSRSVNRYQMMSGMR